MSNHQPLHLSESLKADEIITAAQKRLQEGTQYEYQRIRQRVRKITRISQRLESESSSSSTQTKLSVHYDLEVDIQQESATNKREVKHFNHPHALCHYKLREENLIICTVCELGLVGPAYGCKDCNFFLHKSCLEIPLEIKHKSHTNHPLTLLSHPSYNNGCFLCDACRDYGYAFHYHCVPCKYDLHVACAALPKTVYRKDFKYPLNLTYSSPHKDEAAFVNCTLCRTIISKKGWVYFNQETDYITHLECALEGEFTRQDLEDSVLAVQDLLQAMKVK
ncbi:protein VACUOLELESS GAMETOPHYTES-like [Actinidia eriantha]|uniref:protein VACUOLELESS GAMETOPHYTES-like n=1 Tax=Actinidia eriantha TaxID=165200 RepID=UPI002587D0BB|nr:protein VACUOLELESS GAMETOPHYTES-like [Actinidia eriantha]